MIIELDMPQYAGIGHTIIWSHYPKVNVTDFAADTIPYWTKDGRATLFHVIGIHDAAVNPDDYEYISQPIRGKRYELQRGKTEQSYRQTMGFEYKFEEVPYDKWLED